MDLNVESLLTPIPGDNPAGEDMLFSPEIDALKEARRSDDPSLSLGEWAQELKKADWSKVQTIAVNALTQKSKDLQIAAWLTEALTQQHQFEGLGQGIVVVNRLLENFWETLYPVIEDDDLSYRVGPLEWLNNNMPSVIIAQPLSVGEEGSYSWQDFQQARELDNLGRKDPEAMQKELEDEKVTKVTQAQVDKAIQETTDEFILKNYEALAQCRQHIADLESTARSLYGKEAPNLGELTSAIDNVYGFIARTAKDRQLIDISQADLDATGEVPGTGSGRSVNVGGPIHSREDALRVLAEVSIYFKRSEPHSPIYFLLDRAVKWGNMPLDQWLNEMINEGWNDLPTLLRVIGANQESS